MARRNNTNANKYRKHTRPDQNPEKRSHASERGISRSKALSILARHDECFDHLRVSIIAVELVQLRQPEIITRIVRVGRVIRISSQVAKVLHQHKRSVELLLIQGRVLRDVAQGRERDEASPVE